jgi:hypothetical protein
VKRVLLIFDYSHARTNELDVRILVLLPITTINNGRRSRTKHRRLHLRYFRLLATGGDVRVYHRASAAVLVESQRSLGLDLLPPSAKLRSLARDDVLPGDLLAWSDEFTRKCTSLTRADRRVRRGFVPTYAPCIIDPAASIHREGSQVSKSEIIENN